MNALGTLDRLVLVGVVLMLVVWAMRFVRRSLRARGGCDRGGSCAGCPGCAIGRRPPSGVEESGASIQGQVRRQSTKKPGRGAGPEP